jgi:hypothetical protein
MKPTPIPPLLFKPEHAEKAIESARKNGGMLTRTAAGTWRGAPDDLQQYTTEIVASLVRSNRAVYTRFKEGTKAAVEVRIDLGGTYDKYQMS